MNTAAAAFGGFILSLPFLFMLVALLRMCERRRERHHG